MIFHRIRSGAFSAIPGTLLLAAFLAFVVLVLRIAATESPIMSSDEYAYVANAKYADAAAQVHQMDPGLQQVENRVYPALYGVWEAVSPYHVALAGRIFNALTFVLGALVLFAVFSRIFDRKSALVSALLYLALPLSFYSTTVLPEVEFQLSIYLVAGVVVVAGERPRYAFVVASALLCALSYFIKPHATALILACFVYWFATGMLERDVPSPHRWLRALSRAALFSVTTGLTIVAVGKLLPVGAVTDARVMPSFYRVYVERIFDAAFLSANLSSFAKYVGGHLWVLMAFFMPGLLAIGRGAHDLLRGRVGTTDADDAASGRRAYFALFVALMLAAFVSMVALFTSSAAMGSDFERDRLHGRYLAGLLPFLLAYSVWASSRAVGRIVPVLAIGALASFVFVGSELYRIFPWDYPDVFGFFRPIPGAWTFDGALNWPVWWLLALGSGCWLLALRFSTARWPFVAFSLAWMLAAHTQMGRWQAYMSGYNLPIIAAARAIDSFLGDVPAGSGLIATSDRYGQTSTLLMGLDSPQYVRAFAADAMLGPSDIPEGVRWVVTPRSMGVDIEGIAELDFGNQRLVLLDRKYRWPRIERKADWDGQPILIDISTTGQTSLLHGFNDAEEWGSWSRTEIAFVELPSRIKGPVVLDFFAWQVGGHPDSMLRVALGNATAKIRLDDTGRDYRVELNPTESDDRIMFVSKVVRQPGESRGLGVAIARLRVSSVAERQTAVSRQ